MKTDSIMRELGRGIGRGLVEGLADAETPTAAQAIEAITRVLVDGSLPDKMTLVAHVRGLANATTTPTAPPPPAQSEPRHDDSPGPDEITIPAALDESVEALKE